MRHALKANLELFVKRLLVRSILSDEEQQAILALPVHIVELRKKQDFVHIDEESTYACFVLAGLVGRFGQTSNGLRQFTRFHVPGDVADLHSTVRPIGIGGLNAICDTTILRVPHFAIRTLAARYPAIAEAFWRDCMLDTAVLMQWLINVGRRDARARLAHILCEMAVRSGQDQQIVLEYAFPVTQEQLGDATALTSVHVNRSLKALDSVTTLKSGHVQIHDWDKLARIGEFNPAYLLGDTGAQRQRRLVEAS